MEKVGFFDRKSLPVSQSVVQQAIASMTASCASPDGCIWIGTCDGRLLRLDVMLNPVGVPIQAFPENQPVITLKTSKQCVVALGRISGDKTARLCAYHLYRAMDDTGAPVLVGSVRIPAELQGTCMDVTNDFAFLAVGCAKGQTLIYSGTGFGRPGVKPRILAPEDAGFVGISSVKFFDKNTLFIVTERAITCVNVTDVDTVVVNIDSSVGKLVKTPELVTVGPEFMQSLLVARPDAVYGFSPSEGNTMALELVDSKNSEIHLLTSWNQYIVLFFDATVLVVGALPPGGSKIVAASVQIPQHSDVLGIVPGAFDGHSLLIFTSTVVLNLREKPVTEQIGILTNKALFETAIDLANFANQPAEIVTEIERKYGDHFFETDEFEKAVSVYARSSLESSYVINKFLVAGGGNRTRFLIEYLKKFRSKEHILLRILCLESLGEIEEIKSIVAGLPENLLLELLVSDPEQILRFLTDQDLGRISDAKKLLETLLETQENIKFNQYVFALSAQGRLESVLSQSAIVKQAVVRLAIDSDKPIKLSDLILAGHVGFCKLGTALHPDLTEKCSDDLLLLALELTLRTKGNSRELVRELITRNKASQAMHLCKLLGAPASVILSLSAALNKPLDALAYPAMSLEEVSSNIPSSQNVALNALAVMKRTGQSPQIPPQGLKAAFVLETAESGQSFGAIKGSLLAQWRSLEETDYESKQRAENDEIEISRMKTEMNVLKRKPVIHYLDEKSCSFCNCPLTHEIPVVLFRCLHVYHQHCCSEVCRLCSAESNHHREILSQRKSSVTDHDELFRRMAGSREGKFDAAMAYLGHGLFA